MPRVLPIAERLGADASLAGRGVTIAFLDSGYYAHPDLVRPRSRIAAYHDVMSASGSRRALREPDDSSWHGMMTSVVAAGNGLLSRGHYRGLAHASNVVLVKVGYAHRIVHDDLRRGFEWVLEHRDRYGIRVLNVSCGGDYEASYLDDGLSRAAEDAVRAGITVVAAAGNDGHGDASRVLPPASAPGVITVGGYDDGGDGVDRGHYPSSFGPTIDGLQKPEIVAPSIWVPAPILPGTQAAAHAKLLEMLHACDDARLGPALAKSAGVDPELDALHERPLSVLREAVLAKRIAQKILSPHYKHVDGTSFAAPIVSSLVAQMLEANPSLSPQRIKHILVGTARRLEGIAPERQGFGAVHSRAAVDAARVG